MNFLDLSKFSDRDIATEIEIFTEQEKRAS